MPFNKLILLNCCLLLTIVFASCKDEYFNQDTSSPYFYIELDLNTPTSYTRSLSDTDEYLINDVTLLLFDTEDKLITTSSNLSLTITEPGDVRKVRLTLDKETYQNTTVNFVFLANIDDNINLAQIDLSIGRPRIDILKDLQYEIENVWPVIDYKRPFPMYGIVDTYLQGDNLNKVVYMLRALARVQVYVNNGSGLKETENSIQKDLFTISSVHVYSSRKGGYMAPLVNFTNEMLRVELPSSPEDFEQREMIEPLIYQATELQKYAFTQTIYIPESNHLTPSDIDNPVVLVIGGFYDGSSTPTYYRADFIENDIAYDVIRNHTYDFNIKAVSGPGAPTPEDALDNSTNLNLEVKVWSETKVADTDLSVYELQVSKSVFPVRADATIEYSDVSTTYYTGVWTIENDVDWYKVTKNSAGDGIVIDIAVNGTNKLRNGTFTITAGKLVKKIYVSQLPEKTANCYISSEPGLHGLKATVMGNGAYGATINGTNIASLINNPNYNADGSINREAIKSSRIIWQSRPGLVTSVGEDILEDGNVLTDYDILPYTIGEPLGNELGGNAVIGIYDAEGNVLWSWHIWVVWGWDSDNNLLHFLTTGVRSGFYFMDKNLGALNNEVADANAYGLLYQWGRKDPMRGAARYGSDAVYPTYGFTEERIDYSADNSAEWHQTNTSFTDILNSLRLPMSYSSKWGSGNQSNSAALWGNPTGTTSTSKDPSRVYHEGQKSIYDPCPPGYKVPSINGFYFGTSDSHADCANSQPDNGKAGMGEAGYCDIIANGYYIYYFGRYGGYEKYHTWMPMAPYYNGTPELTSTDGKEDYAFTWLNVGTSGTNAYPVSWHPVNNHIHQYGSHNVEKNKGGTVRCVKETDPDLVHYTVPEKIVLQNPAGSSFMFEVLTNLDWYIEKNNLEYDWFTAVKTSDNSITVTANSANESIYDREGYVTIVFSNGSKAQVRIIQNPVVISLPSAQISLAYQVNSSGSMSFDTPFDSMEFKIKEGSYPIWFTPTLTQVGKRITITAVANSNNYFTSRPDKVTLQLKGEPYEMNVPVVQAAYNINLSPTGDVLLKAPAGTITNVTFTLPNNALPCNIKTDSYPDWLNPVLVKNGANYTLRLSSLDTNYETVRHGHITIVIDEGEGAYEFTLEIDQEAYTAAANKISLDRTNASTGTRTITLPSASTNYAVKEGLYPEWLTPQLSNNGTTLTIRATANSTNYETIRSGVITIVLDSIYEIDVEVEQAAYTVTAGNISLDGRANQSGNVKFKMPLQTTTYTLKPGISYDWLNIKLSNDKEDLQLTATTTSINYGEARTAVITVLLDGVYEVDVLVAQAGIITTTSLSFNNNNNRTATLTIPNRVPSGTEWRIINEPIFTSLSLSSGITTGAAVNITVTTTSANTSGVDRVDILYLELSDTNDNVLGVTPITLTQNR